MLPQEQGGPPFIPGANGGPVGPGNPPAHGMFKPGVSGNPGGRPRGYSPRAVTLRLLAAEPNEHGEGAEAFARGKALLDAAKAGDTEALERELKFLSEIDPAPKEQHISYAQVREGLTLVKTNEPPPPLPVEEK